MRIASTTNRRLAALCATAVALLAPATAAHAEDAAHKILYRCGHGESLAGFPPSAYAKALKDISATTEEYSECGQLIRAAQAAAAQGQRSSGGAGSTPLTTQPVAASPAEQKAISGAVQTGGEPVSLGGATVHPGVVHADVASAFSTLPTPLLVLIAFLLACLLAFGGRAVQKRVRGRSAD